MFTALYLQSTDPLRQTPWKEVVPKMIVSVLFHAIVYGAFVNLASWIFVGKCLTSVVNMRLIISLLCILSVGYVARMYHVQEIYRAYNYDAVKTRQHLDQRFISWIFLA